jgi:GrpB-like predicted nucleotidyltransferase (UPF0157 family)
MTSASRTTWSFSGACSPRAPGGQFTTTGNTICPLAHGGPLVLACLMVDVERYGGGRIVLSDYDPAWPKLFEQERVRVADMLGSMVIRIEHVGSTAVPGLAAKPIIDLLVTVRNLPPIKQDCIQALKTLGYTYLRESEVWLPDEMPFRKTAGQRWTHHRHVLEPTSARWEEFVLIRDYLRAHAEIAGAYGQLKHVLALVLGEDIVGYRDAKRPFLRAVLTKARGERASRKGGPYVCRSPSLWP